jgi:hypothetical protein
MTTGPPPVLRTGGVEPVDTLRTRLSPSLSGSPAALSGHSHTSTDYSSIHAGFDRLAILLKSSKLQLVVLG